MDFNPQTAFRKQPMVYIATAVIIGIILSGLLNVSIIAPIIAGNLFIWYLIARKWKNSYLLIVVIMAISGFTVSSYKNDNFHKSLTEVKTFTEKTIEYSGIVREVNNYSSGQRYILENIQLKSEDSTINRSFKYLVYPKDQVIDNLSAGDTLRGSGKLQLFSDIRNPGEYDFKKYYHNKKIVGKIYTKNKIQVYSNLKWSPIKSINSIRESVRSKLIVYSDTETAALLSALILGDRSKIDQDLRESFANVGVIHVLAVSGLHVGYVLVILLLFVKIIQIPWGWDKLFIVLGLIIFTILSGGRPSVIRASIMASLYIFAPVLNRKPNAWNIIATAAFLILIVNPNSLYDLGFQLSFAAVLSIIYFYSLFNRILPDRLKVSNVKNNVARFFWALLLVSFSAQIGTVPVVAHYFGRIPLVAIIANLLIIPLIGGFVALGIAKLFFFWIPPLSFFINQVNWLIKELIYLFVSIFDKFPYASIQTPQFNWINLIQYILIVALFFLIIQRKYSKIIIFVVLFINSILWPWVFEKKGTDIVFLDLGANESTIIKNNGNKSVLINVGILNQFSDDLNRKVIPAIKSLNLIKFDWLIRSKGNSNHQVGIAKAIESIPIDTVWDVGIDPDSWIDDHIKHTIQLKNIDYNIINRGEVIKIDGQSYIQFLLPVNGHQIENSNLAIKILNGSNSILFIDKLTDNDFKILINDSSAIKSDVLKMSYPKQLPDNFNGFLNIVNPSKVIITGARSSKYSPTRSELYEIIGSELFFTDSVGAVWLFSDGKNQFEVKEW
ncbi:ComEC/Rec2 family competence protein [bacterium]|nr:ComEC/Rec2 family competence protein [bacterium]